MSWIASRLGWIVCCLLPLAATAHGDESAAGDELVFQDSFVDELQPGWTWLREHAARWCVRQGGLEIRVRPGFADTVENALLREVPERGEVGLSFEVTITHLQQPVQQWEQAGLTWYREGRPVFKLVKELVDGRVVIMPGSHPVDGDSVQLRLEVRGDQYTALYRTDKEQPFLTAGQRELPSSGQDQISLQCYHGPPDAEHWVRFTEFKIGKLPSSE